MSSFKSSGDIQKKEGWFMLVHSQLNRTVNAGSVLKCNRSRCSHCSSIVESNSFFSTTTSASFIVRENFTCASLEVIYLITCNVAM